LKKNGIILIGIINNLINSNFKIFKILLLLLFISLTNTYSQDKNIKIQNITTENGLSENNITCILKDSRGFMWFGTYNGLNRYDGYNFIIYRPISNNKSLPNGFINGIAEDKYGNLWIATQGGLCKYIFNEDRFITFIHDPSNPDCISENWLTTIYIDNSQNLWAGNNKGGIDKITLDSTLNKITNIARFKASPQSEDNASNNIIRCILEDNEGLIWIGSNWGLDKLNPKTGEIKYYSDILEPLSPPASQIYTIYEDKKRFLWIGRDIGLACFNPQRQLVKNYNTSNSEGLSHNAIKAITEDNDNNLLIGTLGGLQVFYKKNESFIKISIKRDIYDISNEFISNILYDPSGNIWIGTEKGIKYLHIDKLKGYTIPPKVILTDFKIFNQPYSSDTSDKKQTVQNISALQNITLNHYQNMVSFEFAALSYTMPEKNQYAYMMTGIDRKWIYTDANRRFATYTNLKPGKYIFTVKASNCDGIWNEKGISINLTILPPWWKTIWFLVALSIFLILTTSYIIYRLKNQITRKANQTILDERDQLKTLINNVPDIIFIKDNQSRFIVLNNLAIEFIGEKHKNDFLLKTDFDFYPKEKAEIFYEQEQKILATGIPLTNDEYLETKNGKNLILSSTKCPIINSNGETIGLIGVIKDITERKMIEQEMLNKSEELKSYNEKLNETNTILEERQQQIEEQAEELRVNNEQLTERQKRIEEQAKELKAKTEILKEVNDLLFDKQQLIQEQAKKLQEANDQLKLVNTTKDRFFSIIAHDLRNPFHTIMGFSEILLMKLEQLPAEKIRKYIELMFASSYSGHNLLENLLQWSRTQSGHISFDPVTLNLKTILEDSLKLLEGHALQKNINIELQINQDINVKADENMLKTIIRNLATNAIKFTPNNGQIKIIANKKDSLAEITVADNGIGISEENIKNLFRLDINLTKAGTSNETGSGLGLLLCKEFIEKNNGKICVESTEGKGSTFTITLPLS
jgi:PAS domain S-box-containing protein